MEEIVVSERLPQTGSQRQVVIAVPLRYNLTGHPLIEGQRLALAREAVRSRHMKESDNDF
jgi:hypothetical protein